jgi:hypothetical protein
MISVLQYSRAYKGQYPKSNKKAVESQLARNFGGHGSALIFPNAVNPTK